MKLSALCREGCLCLRLEGELDHHSARETLGGILRALDDYMPRNCVLDLSRVNFMDSSGIAIALHTLQQVKQLGGKMRIVNPSAQVKKVFFAAGIQRMIEMEDEDEK